MLFNRHIEVIGEGNVIANWFFETRDEFLPRQLFVFYYRQVFLTWLAEGDLQRAGLSHISSLSRKSFNLSSISSSIESGTVWYFPECQSFTRW